MSVSPLVDTADMCDICDGKTEQDIFDDQNDRVAARGWTLQGVEPGQHGSGWVHTIGLIENFDSPELVVTGVDLPHGGGLLQDVCQRIADGLCVEAGDALELDGYVFEFEAVHASYLAHGLLASWERYYARIGEPPGPLRALQVVVPSAGLCDHCDRKRRCLSVPGARGFGGGLNRAARRARARRDRRG